MLPSVAELVVEPPFPDRSSCPGLVGIGHMSDKIINQPFGIVHQRPEEVQCHGT